MKKLSISKLRKKADKLWALRVKEQYNFKCAITGKTNDEEPLNAHHIEDRSNLALRWDLMNGICLSAGSHKFRKDSAHKSPVWFLEWLEKNQSEKLAYIRQHRNDTFINSTENMLKVIEKLQTPASKSSPSK